MKSTDLDLPMPGGAIAISFCPPLQAEHYAELQDALYSAETAEELRSLVVGLADEWERDVQFD